MDKENIENDATAVELPLELIANYLEEDDTPSEDGDIARLPDDISASQLIESYMGDFTGFIINSKFPHCIDGLKRVNRRILWCARDMVKYTKENKFVGMVNEYHPHGDLSIVDVVKRMKLDLEYGYTFLDSEGNIGGYGATAGATRYMDVKLSDFAREVFYDGIDKKTIPMADTEDFSTREPLYFIPKLPMALLIPHRTIGVGTTTLTWPLYLGNICDLVRSYSEWRVSNQDITLKYSLSGLEELLLPELPTLGYLLNKDEILQGLRTTNCRVLPPVELEGLMTVTANKIILRTIPYSRDFDRIIDDKSGRVMELLRQRGSWLSDVVTESPVNLVSDRSVGKYVITFKQNTSPFKYLDKLKKLFCFNLTYHPVMHFVTPNRRVKAFTVAELLETWYNARYTSILGTIKYDQIRYIRTVNNARTQLLVADHAEEAATIIRTATSKSDAIENLIDRFEGLSKYQATELVGMPLHSLNKETREDTLKKIDQYEKLAKACTGKSKEIHEIIYKDAEYLMKYKGPRRTRMDTYIGYVNILKDNGLIQFESVDELVEILHSFQSKSDIFISFYRYTSGVERKLLRQSSSPKFFDKFAKQENGYSIVEYHKSTTGLVRLNPKDERIIVTSGLAPYKGYDNNRVAATYVPEKFYTISKGGMLTLASIDDFRESKRITQAGYKSGIVGIIPWYPDQDEVVIFHYNSVNDDVIVAEKIDLRDPKHLFLAPNAIFYLLDVVPIDLIKQTFVVHLPAKIGEQAFLIFEGGLSGFENTNRIEIEARSRMLKRFHGLKKVYVGKIKRDDS